MKKLILFLFVLIEVVAEAQTYIPDNNYRQWLGAKPTKELYYPNRDTAWHPTGAATTYWAGHGFYRYNPDAGKWEDMAASGLYVPLSRTLSINGTSFDLSANRSWTLNLNNVTSAGNTTTNAITTGSITSNGNINVNGSSAYINLESVSSGSTATSTGSTLQSLNTGLKWTSAAGGSSHGFVIDISGLNALYSYTAPSNSGTLALLSDVAVKENSANKATDFSVVNNTLFPTTQAVANYTQSLVTGVLRDRGNYDASSNAFPTSGGSGTGGAIQKGNMWYINVAGTLGGVSVSVGDWVRALVDNPGQTAANWAVAEGNLGYVPANSNGSNASGTWPISVSGNAATWAANAYNTADNNANLTYLMGYNGTSNRWSYYSPTSVGAWLGETLQSVTNRGATTTTPIIVSPSVNSQWAMQVTNSGSTGAHGLYVNIGSSSTGTPFRVDKNAAAQFVVTNGGSVGIGTGAPARQVEQSANGAVEYLMTDVSQGTNLKRWRMFNSAQQLKFGTLSDDASTALDVMALTRDGNVLVGSTTSSTNEKVQIFTGGSRVGLSVSGNSASDTLSDLFIARSSSNAGVGQSAAIQLNDNSVGNGYGYIIQGGIGGLQFFNSANVTGSNWIERMRITPSGSVLIGTTTLSEASVKMDVAGPIRSSNQSIDAGISVVGDAGPNGRSFIQTDTYAGGAAKDLDINPFGGVVYIPNSSVVIGNTAPPSGVLLNVNGKSRQLGFQIFNPNGSTNGKGWEWAPATGTDIMNFNILNDAGGVLGTAMSFQRSGTTLTGIYMGGSAGGTWLSLANGAASFNGRVSGADAINPTEFITKQQFNSLFSVQTGSFTPALDNCSGYSATGSYRRLGQLVIVDIGITVTSSTTTSAGTSAVRISGLPKFSTIGQMYGSNQLGEITFDVASSGSGRNIIVDLSNGSTMAVRKFTEVASQISPAVNNFYTNNDILTGQQNFIHITYSYYLPTLP